MEFHWLYGTVASTSVAKWQNLIVNETEPGEIKEFSLMIPDTQI
jgi:hypothetical protein